MADLFNTSNLTPLESFALMLHERLEKLEVEKETLAQKVATLEETLRVTRQEIHKHNQPSKNPLPIMRY